MSTHRIQLKSDMHPNPTATEQYYNNYFATYFADYYTDYYEAYYTKALMQLEDMWAGEAFEGKSIY